MNKSNAVFLTLAALSLGTTAQASCTGTPVNDLQNLLQNNYVCASLGNDRWQELHDTGNALKDYKKGQNDPVDPSKVVGSWSVANNGSNDATVTYSYTGGSSYSYKVYATGGNTYEFCGVGGNSSVVITGATIPATPPCF